ncbi:glycosyl hydrolase family 65 protein [Nocardia transvalensis]|uniref:glycosyl hydrolase family 65 protein n=1 Tax=Nocardia transvalensis TaxID=37333 RepID=UPI003A5CCACF
MLTGTREEHITADIAWAAHHYAEWTGTTDYLDGPGRDLLTDTARYWASRLRVDEHGHAHLDGVIGPDEYHELVDDNAYTNLMARWNLRRAAALTPRDRGEEGEFATWRTLADRIVDGLHPDGRYEQFTGYFDLEPLTADTVTRRPPVAADVLLGQARVAGSQLIKQPDVLMAHHLIPEELAPGTLPINLDYYGPRTTHGSSLSPAIMATLLARAGRPDHALTMLQPALRMDLDDHTATTAGGLHLATLGGVWQAVLTGFAGIRVRDGILTIRPHLPARWPRLGVAFHCLGRRVRLDITDRGLTVHTDGPLTVAAADTAPTRIAHRRSWHTTHKETR